MRAGRNARETSAGDGYLYTMTEETAKDQRRRIGEELCRLREEDRRLSLVLGQLALEDSPDAAEVARLRDERSEVRATIEDLVAARGILTSDTIREKVYEHRTRRT